MNSDQVLSACGVACAIIWFHLLVRHGRFWMVWRLGAREATVHPVSDPIAVVIPARNEAAYVAGAIGSLLQQTNVDSLHIYLVDDHSDDGTAQVAIDAAVRAGSPDRLTVIAGSELPSGWTGKLWAVQQGVERALQSSPQFLLLTDADIEHAPENVATLVALAETGNRDLVSFMVRLHCSGVPEAFSIPAFVYFFFLLYPPLWIRDAKHKTAGAAGGCMLVRPEALARAGGIQAIHGEVIDDCALAKAVKRSKGRIWLGVTRKTRSIRGYQSLAEISQMIARTAFNQLRHSTWLLLGAMIGLTITFVLPMALMFTGHPLAAMLGAAAYLAMTMSYLPMVRLYELNPLLAFTLPVSAVFYMAATVRSAINYWSGQGGQWKGRAQDLRRPR